MAHSPCHCPLKCEMGVKGGNTDNYVFGEVAGHPAYQ